MEKNPEVFMTEALNLAKEAGQNREVPVGAVVVKDGKVIGRGRNQREDQQSAISHAEIEAIAEANKILGSWRLEDCDLYVTLEPCPMCAGAIFQSRMKRVFYGAADPKAGAVDSLFNLLSDSRLNHQVEVHSGILEDACSKILKDFFKELRTKPVK